MEPKVFRYGKLVITIAEIHDGYDVLIEADSDARTVIVDVSTAAENKIFTL